MPKKPITVAITFSDGSVETHDMSDGGYYRSFNSHRESPRTRGKIIETWKSHIIGWNDGRKTREDT